MLMLPSDANEERTSSVRRLNLSGCFKSMNVSPDSKVAVVSVPANMNKAPSMTVRPGSLVTTATVPTVTVQLSWMQSFLSPSVASDETPDVRLFWLTCHALVQQVGGESEVLFLFLFSILRQHCA
jgi:hypothetical protein